MRVLYVRSLLTCSAGVAVLWILSTVFPNHEAIIDAPIMDLGDITTPEMAYDAEPVDEKAEEAEKSVDVTVRAV